MRQTRRAEQVHIVFVAHLEPEKRGGLRFRGNDEAKIFRRPGISPTDVTAGYRRQETQMGVAWGMGVGEGCGGREGADGD